MFQEGKNQRKYFIEVLESKEYVLKDPPPGKNRLYFESSPYLKQHEDNPVDWWPWCKEAFEKARKENKLILVSIGYSTCHWCHVMERESFSNPEIARLINENFVAIKIDREERPDLDRIFMTICEITIRNCGWPLNVILTPDGLPIFVATYLPPTTQRGLLGLKELIPKIKEIWEKEKDKIYQNGLKILDVITKINEEVPETKDKSKLSRKSIIELEQKAYLDFENSFDEEYGGFGSGAKFPNVSNLLFLLRYWKRTKNKKALFMVEKTLDSMYQGGIYDQIGGGFHRYTVDRTFLIPHFEKMLYDQAQLIDVYSEAYQITKKPEYKRVVYETFEYLLDELYDEKTCGFFSAQDAESEGEEGKYYLWTAEEIENIIGDALKSEIFMRYFGVSFSGNTPHFGNKNILHIAVNKDKIAQFYRKSKSEIEEVIEMSREKLKEERKKRIPPFKDTKILTDWNSLLIYSLAKAGFIFKNEKMIKTAENTAEFILSKMFYGENLYHCFKDGKVYIKGMLDDWAFLLQALLELYLSTQKAKFLNLSLEIARKLIEKFYDESKCCFFMQEKENSDSVFSKIRDLYDLSTPSGNSVAIISLLKLYKITGEEEFKYLAESVLISIIDYAELSPFGFGNTLCALDFLAGPTYEIVITPPKYEIKNGDSKIPKSVEPFLDKLRETYIPNKIIILYNEKAKDLTFIKQINILPEDNVRVYVCSDWMCKTPSHSPEDMVMRIEE